MINQSLLQTTPGVSEGIDRLATSGPLGLAVVVLAGAVVWLILENRRLYNARLEDAKQNTKDMLALSDKVNQSLERLEDYMNKLERVEDEYTNRKSKW